MKEMIFIISSTIYEINKTVCFFAYFKEI